MNNSTAVVIIVLIVTVFTLVILRKTWMLNPLAWPLFGGRGGMIL